MSEDLKLLDFTVNHPVILNIVCVIMAIASYVYYIKNLSPVPMDPSTLFIDSIFGVLLLFQLIFLILYIKNRHNKNSTNVLTYSSTLILFFGVLACFVYLFSQCASYFTE